MRRLPGSPLLTTVALVGITACGAEGDGEPGGAASASDVTVRDSAGIRIVENHDSAWTGETRWRLADEPDFVLAADLTADYRSTL